MRFRLVLALAVAAAPLAPAPAQACICPMPTIDVWPSLGATVPLNTRVVVSFAVDKGWGDGETVTPDQLVFELRPPEVRRRAKKTKAKARTKNGKGRKTPAPPDEPDAPAAVALTVRTWTSGRQGWAELTPTAPLAPGVSYRVLMRRADATPGSESVIGEIVTGTEADATPPTWSGAVRDALVTQGRGPAGSCASGTTSAVVRFNEGAWGAGAAGAPQEVRFAVWRGTGSTETRPPVAIVAARADGFVLGTASACATTNIELAARGETILVRPLDVAGNLGTPATVTLRPEKKASARR